MQKLIIILLLLTGCTLPPLEIRHSWDELPSLEHAISVVVPETTLIIVTPEQMHKMSLGINPNGPEVQGFIWGDSRTIWIVGKMYDGKILMWDWVLGHEFEHIIQHEDGRFVNPDTVHLR